MTTPTDLDPPARRAALCAALPTLAGRLSGDEAAEATYMARLEQALELTLQQAPTELFALAEGAPLERLRDPARRQLLRYYRGLGAGLREDLAGAQARFAALLAEPGLADAVRGRALNSGAIFARLQGDYQRALEWYRESMAIWDRLGDAGRYARALLNSGILAYELHDYAAAEEAFLGAEARFAALGDAHRRALAELELGLLFRDQGRWADSLAHSRRAEAAFAAEGAHDLRGRAWNNIGEALLLSGALAEAEAALGQSLALMETTIYAVDTRLNLGLLHQAQGDDRAALGDYRAALELATANGREEIGPLLRYRLAHAERRLGDLAEARAELAAAAAAIEERRAPLADEGLLIGLMGRWQTIFEEAVLLHLELGEPEAAFAYAERARARAFADLVARAGATTDDQRPKTKDQRPKTDGRRPATGDRATTRPGFGRLSRRSQRLRRSKARPSAARRLRQAQPAMDRLAGRGRGLSLRGRGLRLSKATLNTPRLSAKALRASCANGYRRKRCTPVALTAIGHRPVSAPEVCAALGPGELLLAYFTTGVAGPERELLTAMPAGAPLRAALEVPAQTLLFALSQGGLRAARCAIDPNMLAAGSSYQADGRRFLRPAILRRCYEALLAPVADLLAEARHLIIAPHGPLHQLPFAALLDPGGSPLIERIPRLSYTPSATMLVARQKAAGKRQKGASASGPNPAQIRSRKAAKAQRFRISAPSLAMRSQYFKGIASSPRSRAQAERPKAEGKGRNGAASGPLLAVGYNSDTLRHSEGEAAAVAALGGGEARALAGLTAGEALGLLAGYRRLHFACHAEFVIDDPLASWLELGPGLRLSAAEVLAGPRLGAELVTLSACRSGLSRVLRGDEPMGLVRAFLSAGARAVIVTQWPVEDESARLLMERLYAALAAQGAGADPAATLREAQLALRADPRFGDPSFWAPYQVVRRGG